MTGQPTPGPWTADDGDGDYFGVFGPDGNAICYLAEPVPHPHHCMVPLPAGETPGDDMKMDAARIAVHRANAHMLAAAPVLLATLRKVRDSFIYVDDHSDMAVMPEADNHAFDEVCAAINLAEGRNKAEGKSQ